MLTKITLKDVASYKESEIEFGRDKNNKPKDVFIYGRNGAGKSTLSSFLYCYSQIREYDRVEPFLNQFIGIDSDGNRVPITGTLAKQIVKYSSSFCEFDGNIGDILVYNRDFISENFKQDGMTGIISLGENAKIDLSIERFERENLDLVEKEKQLSREFREKAGQNIHGINSLYESINGEIILITDDLGIPNSNFTADDLLNCECEPDSVISLSELKELIKASKAEAFIMPVFNNEVDEIEAKLNEGYMEYRSKYQFLYSDIGQSSNELLLGKNLSEREQKMLIRYLHEVDLCAENLREKMLINMSLIDKKIKNSDCEISLYDTKKERESYNDSVRKFNDYFMNNGAPQDESLYDVAKVTISYELRDLLGEYRRFKDVEKHYKEEFDSLEDQIEKNKKTIVELEGMRAVLPRQRINDFLKVLGINDYYLKSVAGDKGDYKLARSYEDETSDDTYMTLSEGEKTMLTFVYFMVLCEDYSDNGRKPIVVIDDPISSMSTNFMYNVAALIDSEFTGRRAREKDLYEQVIILTHNLNFFHAMTEGRKGADKYQTLLRIDKNPDDGSKIREFTKRELSNDYQAYWDVLKEYKSGTYSRAHSAIIGNCMRNILERFFGLVENLSCQALFEDDRLPYMEFTPLRSLINNASHSDSTNQIESDEFDIIDYINLFEKLFTNMGYDRHLKIMLGEDDKS